MHRSRSLSRRRFLTLASASGLVLAAHRPLTWAASLTEPTLPATNTEARILCLQLQTAAPLAEMKAFYRDTLGLAVLDESATGLTIAGGATPITFRNSDPGHGAPFYHFAFNIPQNKVRSAWEWQRERTELLPNLPQLRDPDFPEDVVHFRSWNAHSVFFLDPAENVVEYIGRHDLDNGADGPFTESDILYASEIAFVADDVPAMASGLQQSFELQQYRGGGDTFRALGDEHGLVLVFARGRNLSLGHPKSKLADVFPTKAEIRAATAAKYVEKDSPYEIVGF